MAVCLCLRERERAFGREQRWMSSSLMRRRCCRWVLLAQAKQAGVTLPPLRMDSQVKYGECAALAAAGSSLCMPWLCAHAAAHVVH